MEEKARKVIFEKGSSGRSSHYLDAPSFSLKAPQELLGKEFLREDLPIPSLGELEVVRHFTDLSKLNYSIDANFYPLGSCTMKYNPKLNEELSGLAGFTQLHPYQSLTQVQGALELLFRLEEILCEITGMKRFSFQASSGAQGEFTGMSMIRKFHETRKNKKTKVIVPDSSHGTNPATSAMCGYETVVVPSDASGLIDLDKLRSVLDETVAAIMLTNPNTLGLFEENILQVSQMIHEKGGLLYYDGANFNSLLGIAQPSRMGFDVIHLNLHKTFSTPHGCGGPGAGAVGANEILQDYLPTPLVSKKENDKYFLNYQLKHSIGRLRSFYGNFSILVRAYVYLLRLGSQGVLRVAQNALLNASYVSASLRDHYRLASNKPCMHEVVFSCTAQKERGASALDIAKRLIDFGMHPPTMYFPLIVKEALMVEPTETESKETLDFFIDTMIAVDKEINSDLEKIKNAPHTTPVKRVDEVRAARFPDLRFRA